MSKIVIEIPDGKRAEWVNGVLTLVDDKPIEYKFKVGDQVRFKDGSNIYTITDRFIQEKIARYKLDDFLNASEDKIEIFAPQPITERIKTFEDAVDWCKENGKGHLYEQWDEVYDALYNTEDFADIHAYFKLRIITAALNEGWEPKYGDDRFVAVYLDNIIGSLQLSLTNRFGNSSSKLCFKTINLASYAANQFRDLYADFCGCKKNDNQ